MAKPLTKTTLIRVFEYAGVSLPDPDIAMSPEQVRDFLAATGRPELTSAEIHGPERRNDQLVYTLHRVTGTKGQASPRSAALRKAKRRAAVEFALAKLEVRLTSAAADVSLSGPLAPLAKNNGEHRILMPPEVVPWVG